MMMMMTLILTLIKMVVVKPIRTTKMLMRTKHNNYGFFASSKQIRLQGHRRLDMSEPVKRLGVLSKGKR